MILSNFENFIFYWSEKLMKTLEDLANELNREEWAVERMLKNRGYLKNNGEPRKSTIDAGYMNKNGLITNSGWNTFVEELGYKEHEDVKKDNNSDDVKDKTNSEQIEPEIKEDEYIETYRGYEIYYSPIIEEYVVYDCFGDTLFSEEHIEWIEEAIDDLKGGKPNSKLRTCPHCWNEVIFKPNGQCPECLMFEDE